jgi:hypothetical protein
MNLEYWMIIGYFVGVCLGCVVMGIAMSNMSWKERDCFSLNWFFVILWPLTLVLMIPVVVGMILFWVGETIGHAIKKP